MAFGHTKQRIGSPLATCLMVDRVTPASRRPAIGQTTTGLPGPEGQDVSGHFAHRQQIGQPRARWAVPMARLPDAEGVPFSGGDMAYPLSRPTVAPLEGSRKCVVNSDFVNIGNLE